MYHVFLLFVLYLLEIPAASLEIPFGIFLSADYSLCQKSLKEICNINLFLLNLFFVFCGWDLSPIIGLRNIIF